MLATHLVEVPKRYVYSPVNTELANGGLFWLIGADKEIPLVFGHCFACYQSVGAGRLVASTCEAENQGNSGFARRGDLKTMGLPYRLALDKNFDLNRNLTSSF